MPSPENYERKKARETGNMYNSTEYYWKQSDTGHKVKVQRVFVSEDASRSDYPQLDGSSYIYFVETSNGRIGKDYYTNKSKAKKTALQWMRNNPRP